MKGTTLKTIEVVVAPNGTTRVETRGFSGASCQEASRFLEQALGRTTAEQRTAEFHQAVVPQTLDQRQAT